MKTVGAAAFIGDNEGRVLLVKHTYGHLNWELPGGGGEAGESPVETAVREVQEETGLRVTARQMTGCYYSHENESLHFVFHCERKGSEAIPRADGAEISDCAFWSPDALPRPISDWTVQRIRDALSGNHFPLPHNIGPRVWLD